MKKRTIGIILMLVETCLLLLISVIMHYPVDYTIRILFLYILLQYLLGHYRICTSLVWKEIRQLGISHICFYLISLVLTPVKSLNIKIVFINLAVAVFMFIFDLFFSRYLRILFREKVSERVLIIGVGKEAKSLYEVCNTNRFAMLKVQGFIDTGHAEDGTVETDEEIAGITYPLEELENVLREKSITELMLTVPDLSKVELDNIMKTSKDYVRSVKYIPRINGLVTFDSEIEDFDGLIVISRIARYKSFWQRVFKRFVDILGGIAGCILLLPLTLYVQHVYRKNGDHDPIFFRQKRIGVDGKLFEIYKFRTMVPDAENLLKKLMKEDPAIREEYETNKKLKNDPRITKTGQFLRKYSLDEFPQLLNVLKGDMSLVGPRPYLPGEKEDMKYYYNSIIGCKPGITGMWQTHGRSDVGFMDRLEMDDYYYQNWSLWLDITILIKTVKTVLLHDGAI